MLLLTRRSGESVTLTLPDGTEVVVTVLGDGTRLGIEAPRSVEIARTEIRTDEVS